MNNEDTNNFFWLLKFIFQAKYVRITSTTIAVIAFSIAAFNHFPTSSWAAFGGVMTVLAIIALMREVAISEIKRNGR